MSGLQPDLGIRLQAHRLGIAFLPWGGSHRAQTQGRISTAQFLINHMLQTELVHFCAGPSGAGKTRWLLTTLQNVWRRGRDVLGHKSYPVPWVYVPMDRVYASVEATLLDLDIDPLDINVIPAVDLNMKSINEVIDEAVNLKCKLLVIEMFSYLMQGPETKEAVIAFMGATQRALAGTGLTIIGTMESPKQHPRDRYKNPRQRISGPASWGHCAETIILIEPVGSQAENSPQRLIQVLPRNGPHEVYKARFHTNGKLILDKSIGKSAAPDYE